MPIKSKVFIQKLQKSQDRHKIRFAFEFNNKNTKKVFGANLPPPNTIRVKVSRSLWKNINTGYNHDQTA